MESIEMKIAKTAAQNWGQAEPSNLEEAKGITCGSEISSIKGIVSVLGLNPELEQQIIEDVYTKDTISEDIVQEISGKVDNSAIIDILSVVHDEWVKNNPNNFLRVNKDENGQDKPRNKEYQFVPLQMLSWKEAKSDLLFLKPILEAAGIEVDETALQHQFEVEQKEFLIKNKLYSKEDVKSFLSRGEQSYPALEGLVTKNGGYITELLKDDEILERTAGQIDGQIDIKSREEMAMDIIKSDNPLYNDIYHVETTRCDDPKYDGIKFDKDMTLREILLSKSIGKPHDCYEINGFVDYDYNVFKNEITKVEPGKSQKEAEISELQAKSSDMKGKVALIEFGNESNMRDQINGSMVIAYEELLNAGLNPEEMGCMEISKENIKNISKKLKEAEKTLEHMRKHLTPRIEMGHQEEIVVSLKTTLGLLEENYTKEVTPKEIATGSIKKGITSKLVDGAKSLFDRMLGRDEKSTGKDEAENDGRDEM